MSEQLQLAVLSETSVKCGGHDADIEDLIGLIAPLPQVQCPLEHKFAPGVYVREILMPAGSVIIGRKHKTEHFNVVLTGRARVFMNGSVHEVVAPCIFSSPAGTQKVLYILEDMRFATIHATEETDVDKMEDLLGERSQALEDYKKSVAEIGDAK